MPYLLLQADRVILQLAHIPAYLKQLSFPLQFVVKFLQVTFLRMMPNPLLISYAQIGLPTPHMVLHIYQYHLTSIVVYFF